MAKSRKLFVLLLALGLFYECFSLPLTTTVEENNDDDQSDAADDDDDDDQADSDAESGDDGSEGSGSKKDDVANGDDDQDDSDSDDSKPEESKKDDISNDDNNADENASDADDSSENNDEDSDDSNDDTKDEKATKKAEVPLAEEEVQDVQNANEEDSEEELTAENMGKEEERQLFKRQGGGDEHHEHHHHDHEHDHGHHEHEHEHHHHGHHHGFIHEWGQEEGGEHHGHEGHGHHEHEHEHDHEHEHEHHQHHHGHHHDGHHHHEGYGWGRSDLPMAYHCRDMISKSGDNKAVTKRFCVPIGYHNNYEVQYFHGYPGNMASRMYPARNLPRNHIEQAKKKQTVHVGYGYASGDNYRIGSSIDGMGDLKTSCERSQICADLNKDNFEEPQGHIKKSLLPAFLGRTTQRDHIEHATKKQTVHVGYGYASGDNYRLGYQAGGMGGLASQFSNDNNDPTSESNHNGIDGRVMMNNKKSDVEKPLFRRQFNGPSNMGHGFGGHSTPYGHPVTHPGFTTMGFPGHALASTDVRNKINHPKVKRQLFNGYPQGMFAPQQPSPYGLNRAAEFQSQMDPPPGPGFPSMMGQTGEQPENLPMGMNQEEMGGSMRSDIPHYPEATGYMPITHE